MMAPSLQKIILWERARNIEMGGPEKGRVDFSKRTYARSPRIRRASWMSFGIMVTLLA